MNTSRDAENTRPVVAQTGGPAADGTRPADTPTTAHGLTLWRIDTTTVCWAVASVAMLAAVLAHAGWRAPADAAALVALLALPAVVVMMAVGRVAGHARGGRSPMLASELLPLVVTAGAVAAASARTGDRPGAVAAVWFSGALWVATSYAGPLRVLAGRAASARAARLPARVDAWFAWVAAAAVAGGGAAAVAPADRPAMIFAVIAWTVGAVGFAGVSVATMVRACVAREGGRPVMPPAVWWTFAAATASMVWAGSVISAVGSAPAAPALTSAVAPATVVLAIVAAAWVVVVTAVQRRSGRVFHVHGAVVAVAVFAVCATASAATRTPSPHPGAELVGVGASVLSVLVWSALTSRAEHVRRGARMPAAR